MSPPNIRLRGLRSQPIPSGYVLGRTSNGDGEVELIHVNTLASQLTATGVPGTPQSTTLPSIGSGDVLGNSGASSATAADTTLTALLDRALGNTQGNIIYRDASVWKVLTPPTGTDILLTADTTSNPSWETLTSIFDTILGSAQGDILYRNATQWVVLTPGTDGQFLQTKGSANPIWATPAGGTGGGLYSPDMSTLPTSTGTGLTTWVNQGGASVSDSAAGVCITAPSSSASFVVRARSMAVSGAYTIKTLVAQSGVAAGSWAGIGWYDGTKLHLFGLNVSSGIYALLVGKVTDTTHYSANDTFLNFSMGTAPIWLQITDDGTNISFSYATDGENFVTVQSTAKASAFLGSTGYTNAVFFVVAQNTAMQATLMSYKKF